MKYKYHLTIEKNEEPLLEMHGGGVSRNEIGTLKAVRRSITSTIREQIEGFEKKQIHEG